MSFMLLLSRWQSQTLKFHYWCSLMQLWNNLHFVKNSILFLWNNIGTYPVCFCCYGEWIPEHEKYVGDCHVCRLYSQKGQGYFGRQGTVCQVLAEAPFAILYHSGLEIPNELQKIKMFTEEDELHYRYDVSLPMHTQPDDFNNFCIKVTAQDHTANTATKSLICFQKKNSYWSICISITWLKGWEMMPFFWGCKCKNELHHQPLVWHLWFCIP